MILEECPDGMNISQSKQLIRNEMLDRLKKQSSNDRRKKSLLINEKLQAHSIFQRSKVVMFYLSTEFEVDTTFLFRRAVACKTVLVPYVESNKAMIVPVAVKKEDDLVKGSYGIMEPKPELVKPFDLNKIELVLVPGLAFDKSKQRLGRGKGYYDRFFKTLPPKVKRFGLSFDFQLLDSIPTTSLDERVDEVIVN